MTLEERIRSGKLYFCTAPGFAEEQERCLELLYDYNATRPGEKAKRREILSRFFGSVGENLYIEPPLHASFGKNTHWGDICYANFNLTLVDDGEIRFGDHVMIAPNVVITATGHPVHPELRKKTAQFSIPVRIGSNVWIGAGAVILPGVTIGDNTVIGAGSIVTHDIPADCVAVGNPCRVVRGIGERDFKYYYKDREIDVE